MKRNPAGRPIPRYVVCPRCHTPLIPSADSVRCTLCSTAYPRHTTVHFAELADDAEKARQQVIYDGHARDTVLMLPYRDLEQYRDFCARITDLIRRRGLDGHQLKALKTRTILDRLKPRAGDRLLDIGSGAGSTLALLTLRYGVTGTGIDISPVVVEHNARANPWGHEYYQADAEQLPFLDDTFDGIVTTSEPSMAA